jgi:hypothetical protein
MKRLVFLTPLRPSISQIQGACNRGHDVTGVGQIGSKLTATYINTMAIALFVADVSTPYVLQRV